MDFRPLNIFQRCIRVWEQTHPYNAAQVLHLAGTADVARLGDTWNEVLGVSGLGIARVVGRRFRYEPAPRQDIAVVDRELGLERFITGELNRPFDRPSESGAASMPFRPFVLPGDGTYHLGLIYQHWVADSVSVRMLLREWFCRLHDPASATRQAVHVPRGGFWRYFGPGRAGWSLAGSAASLVGSMRQFSNARRIPARRDDGQQQVECSVHHLPDGMVQALLDVARRQQVTLHDLLLAALARACDEHGAPPRRAARDLALGTIVDLRAMSSENLDNTFGLFLGFTSVVAPADTLGDSDRLLASIASQNARHKERRSAAASMLRLAAAYTQMQFLSQRQLAAFYRNYMPLSGGASNVNMNRSWTAPYHPSPLLDYIRVAPTGPMLPVVIAATTIGRRFSFVLTRRGSLVDKASGDQLARTLVDELTARAKM
jgi:hypothetical protein